MELDRTESESLDISVAGTVQTYTYTGSKTLTVISRVELGSEDKPIVGGGIYNLTMKLNGVPITPVSNITVPSGQVQAIIESRPIVVDVNDVLTVIVTGNPADTDIWAQAILFDNSPAQLEELTGRGAIVVDHNYPEADDLLVTDIDGVPIDNAQIRAYLRAHWNNNLRSAGYVVASSRTDVDGHWESPMLLDPGTYILLTSKQGSFQPRTTELVVS